MLSTVLFNVPTCIVSFLVVVVCCQESKSFSALWLTWLKYWSEKEVDQLVYVIKLWDLWDRVRLSWASDKDLGWGEIFNGSSSASDSFFFISFSFLFDFVVLITCLLFAQTFCVAFVEFSVYLSKLGRGNWERSSPLVFS